MECPVCCNLMVLAPGEQIAPGPVRFVCVTGDFEVVRTFSGDPGAPRKP